MFRILKSALALSTVLALAACNSTMAPVVEENVDDAMSADHNSKRNDHEFVAVGDEFSPMPDEGGGTGNRHGDQQEERDSAQRGKRSGQEVIAVGDEFSDLPDDGGGTGNRYGDQQEERDSAQRRARGQEVSP